MVRRLLKSALIAVLVSAALAPPALAQGNGNGGEQGNSEGKGNSENAASSNAGGVNANSSKAPAKADEDLALEAVRAEDALPLELILESVRQSTTSRVIDAQLFSVDGVLVYEVKVLSPDGQVSLFYYYAGSGRQFSLD